MRILYLYIEVMGYTMATIKALVQSGAEVHIVSWDDKKLTPYEIPPWPQVHMYKRSEMTVDAMRYLTNRLAPAITVVSAWQDNGYLPVVRRLRSQGGIVVAGFDDQWHGALRQYLAASLALSGYFRRYFSHAWVSGVYQYEYARRLGFNKNRIIYDLYSADLSLCHKSYESALEKKRLSYPHRFLFVGRFHPIKGLATLLKAWQILGSGKQDWELHLIGGGDLSTIAESGDGVVVHSFMQPEKLIEQIAQAGCFVLPSISEPWGVVVHECAAAGLPLITSDAVGAATAFLISGYNGYTFKAGAADALAGRMRQIIELNDQALMTMGAASHALSHRISPQTSAASLLSVLNHEQGQ